MSPQLIPRLFKFSHRSAAAIETERTAEPALARTIVEMHGGRIEAHSQGNDLGSEFLVTCRRPRLSATPRLESYRDGLSGRAAVKVLLDDNGDATDSCAAFLELAGHEVHTTYTGRRFNRYRLATRCRAFGSWFTRYQRGLEVAQTAQRTSLGTQMQC
jgi:transposase InsO family protein